MTVPRPARPARLAALACVAALPSAQDLPVPFEAETVDDGGTIGYGVAIGDVDGDGKPDLLLADKRQIVWYRSPGWGRHLLAEAPTERDNVCIAARDLDGDGKVEVAFGSDWNPGNTADSGRVHYLVAPEDRTKPWRPVELPCEPTVHRMRWVRTGESSHALVVAPLHGRDNRGGEGAGVRLLAYELPADPDGPWPTAVLEDTLHVTHNLDPVQWDPATPAEEVLYIGREGARAISLGADGWSAAPLPPVAGGGEIRLGHLGPGRPFVATIEPLHGHRLALYRVGGGPDGALGEAVVLDERMKGGHALACADLFGGPGDEVVAGWRLPDADGRVGLRVHWAMDAEGSTWASALLDDGGMATEDVRVGDLDGDGRADVVAAGRSTGNLKVYWNRGE